MSEQWKWYEILKASLQEQNLSPAEYGQRLRELLDVLGL